MPELPVLDPVEQRVLGALLEKQRTVPDSYPLSLNSLRTACNQSTSRDPVVAYDEATLVDTLNRLRDRELVRFVKPTGLRVVKYHQRLEEHLGLDAPAVALLTASAAARTADPGGAASADRATARLRRPGRRRGAAAGAGRSRTRRWSASWSGRRGSTTDAGSTCSAPSCRPRPSTRWPPSTGSRCWPPEVWPATGWSPVSTTGSPRRTRSPWVTTSPTSPSTLVPGGAGQLRSRAGTGRRLRARVRWRVCWPAWTWR